MDDQLPVGGLQRTIPDSNRLEILHMRFFLDDMGRSCNQNHPGFEFDLWHQHISDRIVCALLP